MHRFLGRLWRLSADVADTTPDAAGARRALGGDDLELLRKAHWAIEKVTNDMAGRFAFNTAIAAIMELTNTSPSSARTATRRRARCASP